MSYILQIIFAAVHCDGCDIVDVDRITHYINHSSDPQQNKHQHIHEMRIHSFFYKNEVYKKDRLEMS